MYLLDTNIVSEARRGSQEAVAWLQSIESADVHFSVVSFGEMTTGIERHWNRDRQVAERLQAWLNILLSDHSERILPITLPIALEWGRLSAIRPRNAADGLIAATAIVHGLTLATRNVRDFADLPLALINPWEI